MPAYRRALLSVAVAAVLLAGVSLVAGLAQDPGDTWLVRLPCPNEASLRRLLGGGMRVILWQDGRAYVLVAGRGREWMAARGMVPQPLSRRATRGDYYVVRATEDEAEALGARYGPPVALGEGCYLLGLEPGDEMEWPGFAYRLPFALEAPRPPAPPVLEPRAPDAGLDAIVSEVSQSRLENDIAQLQDDDAQPGPDALRSRYTMTTGLGIEAEYIAAQLQATGLQVEHFPVDYTRGFSDVIGILEGARPESEGFFIVCAHYDSTSGSSGWESRPAPGADDNASGTAGVLEAARVLADESLDYGVRFCLFGGEEQGLIGSAAYAEALHNAGANLLGVINLDMIAYDSNDDGRVEIQAGTMVSPSQLLAQALVRNLERHAPELQPAVKTSNSCTGCSDHFAFWQRGYPAILAIESFSDSSPYYHTTGDVLASLNISYCRAIVRGVVGMLGELAAPQPDLAGSRKVGELDDLSRASAAYAITLENQGYLTATATLTDVLPPELALDGPITATWGTPTWDEETRRLGWTGEVGPQSVVTITYEALIAGQVPEGTPIRNEALVDDGAGQVYRLGAEVSSPWRLALPVIMR